MPCPHFKISIRQRSKRQSAVAGAAYQAGESLFSEYDQRTKNYRYKAPEVVCAEILLPDNAPKEYADRQTLWNAAEKVEQQWNSQLSRGIIMAIPRELPRETWADLVRDYCREQFVSKGMCVDYAIHDKGDGNPHAHIMLTMHSMDGHGKWNPKAHKVYDLDGRMERIVLPSGEFKSHKENVVDWNDRKYAEVWRQAWANAANRYLEVNNRPERLDLRSYARQCKEIVPTVHLGPAVAHMEAKGIRTGVGDLNREIRSHNAAVRSVKAVIFSLEKWLADTKEKLARLFEKEEQKPTLFDVLTAYNSLRRDERSDWSKYGKQSGSVADLKFFSSAVNWMQRTGVVTVEDFDALLTAQKPAIAKITENEKQIRKLKTVISHIDDLGRYKPIFEKSKTGFKSFREKYTEAHKDELDKFAKAIRYLKANQLNATDRETYQRELDVLLAENERLAGDLRRQNLDPDMLRQIKHCVDTVLAQAENVPEVKASVIEKLHLTQEQQQAQAAHRKDIER